MSGGVCLDEQSNRLFQAGCWWIATNMSCSITVLLNIRSYTVTVQILNPFLDHSERFS